MNRRLALCAALVLVGFGALSSPASCDETSAFSSHEKAARDLYRLVGGAKTAEAGAEAMMVIIRQKPELAPYEDVFRAWYHKMFAADDFEGEVARLYMGAFTEEELVGLAAFYHTPLGQKALATFPDLMKKAAEAGMRRAQEHAGELQEMIARAKKEREEAKTPPP